MLCVRSTWVLPIVLTLTLAVGACKKGTSGADSDASPAEPSEAAAEEEGAAPAEAPAAKGPTRPPKPTQAPSTGADVQATTQKPAPAPAAAEGSPVAAAAPAAAPTPAIAAPATTPQPAGPRAALLDPRLLLTLKDIQDLAKGKATFRRVALQGVPNDDDTDAILYEPEKGSAYGAALQVFRARTAEAARERFTAMLASYPSAQEIPPVAGKTFFAYWEEILYVGFLVPSRNLVVVLSCGRKFCDSDGLYELARKVGARTNG